MKYPVIVQSGPDHEVVAEPLGRPDLGVRGATEAEALEQVERNLGEWLRSAKVVHLEVPGIERGNPWLDHFGRSADDPDFEEYLRDISRGMRT
jgi:hypothetical protein